MKKTALFSALLFSSASMAADLHDYDAVKNAISDGKPIRIVVDFAKCVSSDKSLVRGSVTGVYSPDAIMMVGDQIITSLKHFSLNSERYSGKPVYEFVKYIIASDNNVTVSSQVLDAVNYAPINDAQLFNCKLDGGAKIYS